MRAKILNLLLVFFVLPCSMAHAQDVGRVLLAAGDVTATRGAATLKLTPGTAIQDKDVLRTGAASNLQVRFVDDSMVSLRENSELRVEEFRFSGKEDGSERAFFSLVKGGLRAFTGLVGRSNNRNYRMTTNTAVIGIRGTDYVATLCEQGTCRNDDGSAAKDGLYGRVLGASHGTNRVNVKNDVDERQFGINENFYVADSKSLIQPLIAPPDFLSGKLEGRSRGGTAIAGGAGIGQNETNGTQHDSRISTVPPLGTNLLYVAPETTVAGSTPYVPVLTSMPATGPVIGVVGAWSFSGFPTTTEGGGALVTSSMLVLNGSGDLVGINFPAGTTAFPDPTNGITGATGVLADLGTDLSINAHWGRWTTGSITDGGSVSTFPGGAHFLYGDLTPPDVVAAKTGTSVLFSSTSGTLPTSNVGGFSGGIYPSITLNFLARTGAVSGFSWTFGSDVWSLNATSGRIFVVPGQGGTFVANGTGNCGAATSCGGSPPATYNVNGIFLGAQGNHLGVSIGMQTTTGRTAEAVRLYGCAPSC